MNISGTLGGGLECGSNNIVRSLCKVVVVEVVLDMTVVVNVVGEMVELIGSVVGADES